MKFINGAGADVSVQSFSRVAAAAILVLGLAACGGGGGSRSDDNNNNPPPGPPSLESQTLEFSSPGPVNTYVGEVFENPASSAGTGAVTYSSSDEQIANVDGNGHVQVLAPGRVTISAEKAADTRYKAASASYVIEAAVRQVVMRGWIGEDNTQVSFSDTAYGLQFLRSSDETCMPESYAVCAHGQLNEISGQVIVDSAATLKRPAFYRLFKGEFQTQLAVQADDPLARSSHESRIINHNGKMWLFDSNNIWWSRDGVGWVQATDAAAFAPRSDYRVTSHDGKLWLIGGRTSPSIEWKNDIWYSVDGEQWQQAAPSASFSVRRDFQLLSHQGKIWVIGGIDDDFSNENKSDVWSSVDGIHWEQHTSGIFADFFRRYDYRVASHNGKLWLIGGWDVTGDKADVWSSVDGTDWVLEKAEADFSARYRHLLVSYAGKLWLVGGVNSEGLITDIWSSDDGIGWSQEVAQPAFGGAEGNQLLSHAGKLWLIEDEHLNRKAWASRDGVDWSLQAAGPAFSPRYGHRVAVHQDMLWLVGGSAAGVSNEVWTSIDGEEWTLATNSPGFSARMDHQLVSHSGKLWVIGGWGGDQLSDVWSSDDGVSWIQKTDAAAFSGRRDHQVVSFKNKLWLIGGSSGAGGGGHKNDIWSSSDGVIWEEENAEASFPPSAAHKVVAYRDRLWLIGAGDISSKDDLVWTTSDGVEWSSEVVSESFPSRSFPDVVVHENKLWLVGGWEGNDSSTVKNDVWSSTDGLDWEQEASSINVPPTHAGQLVNFDDSLWFIGGYSEGDKNQVWKSQDGVEWRKLHRRELAFPDLP